MRGARRRTVPTELAALAMGVSEATIRKWASRGRITRYGGPQRAEYDLDELLVLTHPAHPQPQRRSQSPSPSRQSTPDRENSTEQSRTE
ncbi:transcriptional regulator [Streptomyces sp. NPDC005574]|uniref:transcriptional regulator n=1 Tax=Streptomyces sp. NPDC005574 TaxID=3156891 RepID=UPI0033BB8297